MNYGLICAIFVCLLCSVGLVAAAVVLLVRADTWRRATMDLERQLAATAIDAKEARALVDALNTKHYTTLATDLKEQSSKVARLIGQVESWEESLRNLSNKWTAREKNEARAAAKAAKAPEDVDGVAETGTEDERLQAALAAQAALMNGHAGPVTAPSNNGPLRRRMQ